MAEYVYNADGSVARIEHKNGSGAAMPGSGRFVRYSYRIEGWLSRIGDVDGTQHTSGCTSPTSVLPSGCAQPFAQRLAYTPGGLIQQATVLSPYAVTGSTTDSGTKKWHYSFAYDGLSRLKSAAYNGALTGRFSLRGVTYDAGGNILSLNRNAPTSAAAHAVLDSLTYAYAPGTNRLTGMADAADYAGRTYFASRRDDADPATYSYTLVGSVREEVRTPYTAGGVQEVHARRYTYDEQQLPVQIEWAEYADAWEYSAFSPRLVQTYYYRYSGSGQRIWESAQGQVRRTVRGAGGEALAVFDGSGALRQQHGRRLH